MLQSVGESDLALSFEPVEPRFDDSVEIIGQRVPQTFLYIEVHGHSGLFQCRCAFTQRLLRLLRVGDVEHCQQAIAIRQRHTGKTQTAPVGKLGLARMGTGAPRALSVC